MVYVIQVCRRTPDDGQRNCPKYVEFYSKNKFEKLVHLVDFIIRIYHEARSPERQKQIECIYHFHFIHPCILNELQILTVPINAQLYYYVYHS